MKQKRILLVILWTLSAVSMYSQHGYWYNDHFVELMPKYANRFYIQLADKMELSKTNYFDHVKSVAPVLQQGFIIESEIRPSDDTIYVSDIYRNKDCESIVVLPRIIMCLKEEGAEKDILGKYGKFLTLYKQDLNICRFYCNLPNSKALLDLVSELHNNNLIEWCEPVLGFSVIRHNNNEFYPEQYYLKNTGQNGGTVGIDINVEPAWNLISGSPNITIAVIDDGVDPNHEDMTGIVLSGLTTSNPLGYGEPQNINDQDVKGHGTACAGLIAALDNSKGIKGVASGVKILPVNIFPNYSTPLNDGIELNSEILADAIIWASQRSDVISCSWSGTPENAFVTNAFRSARENGRNGKGTIVVFASGNSGNNWFHFPVNLEGVVSVGAIDSSGSRWDYSQYGDSLKVVAPSGDTNLYGDIVTTDRMGALGYDTLSNYTHQFGGTSAACPQVAGVFGLMLSANPLLTEVQAKQILYNTCRKLNGYDTIWDEEVGYGLVDAGAAVEACILKIVGPDIPCGMSYYKVTHLPQGYSVSWSWKHSSSINIYNANSDSCLIVNYTQEYIDNVLVATISKNGIVEATLEKVIDTGAGFSGTYWELPSTAPVSHPFTSGQTLLVTRGKTITLMSSDFIGAIINLTGSMPTSWSHNGNQITLYYANLLSLNHDEIEGLSGLGIMATTITGKSQYGCMTYRFSVIPRSGSILSRSNDLSIVSSSNGYVFDLVPLVETVDAISPDNKSSKWTLTIVHYLTGKCVYDKNVEHWPLNIDTFNWEPGIYVVQAKTEGETLTKKISINKP
jgi:subtilisin family serine protease